MVSASRPARGFDSRRDGGIDARQPEGLVSVDVAHARDRPLRQELGLDAAPAGSQGPPEALAGELVAERLRAEAVEGGDALMAARGHDMDPAEPAHVVQGERIAVIEPPPGPQVRMGPVDRGVDRQPAGHSQMDDELASGLGGVVQVDDQVLAAAADRGHVAADRLHRGRELGRRMGARPGDRPALQPRLQLGSDGLHFGKLGHRPHRTGAGRASEDGLLTSPRVRLRPLIRPRLARSRRSSR